MADTKYNAELILDMMKKVPGRSKDCSFSGTLSDRLYLSGFVFAGTSAAGRKGCADEISKRECFTGRHFFVGLPFEILGKLYNVAAVFSHGEVLGLVPKSYLPNYNEFYEARHFVSGAELATEVVLPDGSCVPADRDLLFVCEQMPKLRIGVELCEDLWTPNPPSISHALAGASVLVNLSASNELTGKTVTAGNW